MEGCSHGHVVILYIASFVESALQVKLREVLVCHHAALGTSHQPEKLLQQVMEPEVFFQVEKKLFRI